MSSSRYDLILVGGGLANSLLAFRLAALRPSLNLLVLESDKGFGGNHTWSFHLSDLTPDQREWTAPFVAHQWPCYTVAFPGLHRRVDLPYCSATSALLDARLAAVPIQARFGVQAETVTPTQVRLSTGEVLDAAVVIDGRGFKADGHLRLGWQKFFGQEIRLAQPHRLTAPILMDATVAQHDGYRFVYVLPFAPDRLLIEDTYYSDSPDLDPATLRGRIADYAWNKGWTAEEVVREEAGTLPITLAGDFRGFWTSRGSQPCSGLRAGLFHPTTGFSWLEAVRLADHIARLGTWEPEAVGGAIRTVAAERWRRQAFFRVLNRMLFRAGDPAQRWVMMRRFYKMPESTISRFYAGTLSIPDKARLLVGRPPVSVLGAIRAILDDRVG